MRLGATLCQRHNDRSQSDRGGNPFKGKLTNGQLENRINWIIVRITDDSPEDGVGGPTVFDQDIEVHTQIGGSRHCAGRQSAWFSAAGGGSVPRAMVFPLPKELAARAR